MPLPFFLFLFSLSLSLCRFYLFPFITSYISFNSMFERVRAKRARRRRGEIKRSVRKSFEKWFEWNSFLFLSLFHLSTTTTTTRLLPPPPFFFTFFLLVLFSLLPRSFTSSSLSVIIILFKNFRSIQLSKIVRLNFVNSSLPPSSTLLFFFYFGYNISNPSSSYSPSTPRTCNYYTLSNFFLLPLCLLPSPPPSYPPPLRPTFSFFALFLFLYYGLKFV